MDARGIEGILATTTPDFQGKGVDTVGKGCVPLVCKSVTEKRF